MTPEERPVLEWELSPSYFRKKNFLNFLTAWIVSIVAISAFTYVLMSNPSPENAGSIHGMIIFGVVISSIALLAMIINVSHKYKGYNYRIDSDGITITREMGATTYKWSDVAYFKKEELNSMGGRELPAGYYNAQTAAGYSLRKFINTYNYVISIKRTNEKIVILTRDKKNSALVSATMAHYLRG